MKSTSAALDLPVISSAGDASAQAVTAAAPPATIVLVGNPNTGKTSLFNRLTGLRAKSANFPGTTVEHRRGEVALGDRTATLVDLPGLYSLTPSSDDERVAVQALEGVSGSNHGSRPDLIVLVLDATNLPRNLFLASQVIQLGRPTIAALAMMDAATAQGITVDVDDLSRSLGCPVTPVSARTGTGFEALLDVMSNALRQSTAPVVHPEIAACTSCSGCQYGARFDWAERVAATAVRQDDAQHHRLTEALDRVLTHRVFGLACFAVAMTALFALVFWLAQFPMGLIESLFGWAATAVGRILPAGDISSLATDGLLAGIGGVLTFLPQICLLFFAIAILEDTGYMARAALVMDRLMQRVGLPGKAFIPMLSAHACAIPAIMATRVIEDRRDRLATILVIPLMSCSARVPVYAVLVGLLFPHSPWKAALLFAGAYAVGIVAALALAWVLRGSLLKGRSKPLVIELPSYRRPSFRNALLATYDRAAAFVASAGTTILVITVAMWALATYPKTPAAQLPAGLQTQMESLKSAGDDAKAESLLRQAQLERSLAGRLGQWIQPVFAPLGFDWRTTVGVMTSFAARETVVSTLSVLYGLTDGDDATPAQLDEALQRAKRPDGQPQFTTANCLSLLVFYILAMQCLPTQAVTRRETGTWKWPLVQLGSMSAMAYIAALLTYQIASRWG